MKTQYYTASSLDGFIADPENSLDWLMQLGDPEGTSYPDFIRDVGALAMGSTTTFVSRWDSDNAAVQKTSPGMTAERRAEILAKLSGVDYSNFDSLAAAVDYGHSIGLKIHAWATINEDDHGWGWRSEFAKAESLSILNNHIVDRLLCQSFACHVSASIDWTEYDPIC